MEYPANDEAADPQAADTQSKKEDNEGDSQGKQAQVLVEERREGKDPAWEAGKGKQKDDVDEKEDEAEEWEEEELNNEEREDEEEEEVTNSA